MPVRTIVKWPDPRLSIVADSVDPIDPFTRSLARDLVDTMRSALGVGLAAPQVGIEKSVCVICIKAYSDDGLEPDPLLNEAIVLVNPKVTPSGEKTFQWREACLSVDEITEYVVRHENIELSYQDLLGKTHTKSLSGNISGVVQHETDHLIGKTFLERVSSDKRRKAKSKIISKKRAEAERIKKEIKREKKEAALEKAQQEEPPKPGFRCPPKNKGHAQKKKRKKTKKSYGRNKNRR